MYKPDTVILYNFSPRVDEAAIRLALGESRIAKTVWSSGATIGKFVIVKLSSVAVARRLLAGGANATLPAPAEDEPIRVCISGVPMCVAPSPISIDDVALPVRASKKAAAAGDASAAASPVRKSAGGQPRASSTPFTCNECGKEGHKARECPSKPPKAPVSCFRCGQEGHISKECTQPADEQSSPAKRGAPAANGKVQSQRDGGAASPAVPPRGAPKAKGSDECKKCGSTEHLTRQCPGGGNAAAGAVGSSIATAAKSAEPIAAAVPAAPTRAPPKVVPALGQASAKQATKFADSDDDEDAPLRTVAKPKPQPAPLAEAASRAAQPSKGSAPSPTIAARPSQQEPKAAPTIVAKETQKTAAAPVVAAAPPKPPTIARAPGADSCKFCGSDEHLSRRCPKKSG